MDPIYPDIHVQLTDEDGNAFSIIGRVREALRDNGIGNEEITSFTGEAMSSTYDHLLQTVMKWVHVD